MVNLSFFGCQLVDTWMSLFFQIGFLDFSKVIGFSGVMGNIEGFKQKIDTVNLYF